MRGARAVFLGVVLVAAAGCQGRERPGEAVEAEPAPEHLDRVAAGSAAFGQYCALCHKADATGYAADNAPSLVSTTFLESATDDFISRGIRDGRAGTAMAAYAKMRGGPLDDDEVASIIAFLRDEGPLRIRLPTTPVVGETASGEIVYATYCQNCHGTRDERKTAVSLFNPNFLSTANDGFLRHAVVHGRPGTPMPSFEGVLREDQIDNVIAYVRSGAMPPPPPRRAPAEPPPIDKDKLVINPHGAAPDFTLRDGRFASIDAVHAAYEAKQRMIILDARAASDWYGLHIPGSVSAPYYSLGRLDPMPKDGTWIIAYCACPHHASGAVVDELRKRGYPHTAVLDEGIFAWQRKGYPTAREPLPDDPAEPAKPQAAKGAPPPAPQTINRQAPAASARSAAGPKK